MRTAHNSTLRCNNTVIVGHNNTIHGNNNNITGNNNKIYGNVNFVTGNNNKMEGNNNDVIFGNNNKIITGNKKPSKLFSKKYMNDVRDSFDNNIINDINITTSLSDLFSSLPSISSIFGDQSSLHNEDDSPVQSVPPKIKEIKVPLDSDMQHDKEIPVGAPENTKACVICISNEPNCIIMKCMHKILCIECSIELGKGKMKGQVKCPECRGDVTKILRVFE